MPVAIEFEIEGNTAVRSQRLNTKRQRVGIFDKLSGLIPRRIGMVQERNLEAKEKAFGRKRS